MPRANVLRGEMRGKGRKGGESNGECEHGQQTSDERVWVAVVHSIHLHYPGSDSGHRLQLERMYTCSEIRVYVIDARIAG